MYLVYFLSHDPGLLDETDPSEIVTRVTTLQEAIEVVRLNHQTYWNEFHERLEKEDGYIIPRWEELPVVPMGTRRDNVRFDLGTGPTPWGEYQIATIEGDRWWAVPETTS